MRQLYQIIPNLICIVLIIPLFRNGKDFLWLIPIFLLLVINLFCKDKHYTPKRESTQLIMKSAIFDFVFFVIFLLFFYLFRIKISFGVIGFVFCILFLQNIYFQSFGNKIMKIRIVNSKITDKMRIFIWNFCKVSIFYFTILLNNLLLDELLIKKILEIFLFLYMINMISPFLLKDKSLLMRILRIAYESDSCTE